MEVNFLSIMLLIYNGNKVIYAISSAVDRCRLIDIDQLTLRNCKQFETM